ncbi:hypothetical protein V6N13_136711 [Hibiscus sabdariffa]
MNGGSLGLRTGSNGSLQSIKTGNGRLLHSKSFGSARKNSIMMLSGSREKERSLPSVRYRCLGRRKVSMLLLVALALLVFVLGSFVVSKVSNSPTVDQRIGTMSMAHYLNGARNEANSVNGGDGNRFQVSASKGANHPCANFTFPPPPPPNLRRIGPRLHKISAMNRLIFGARSKRSDALLLIEAEANKAAGKYDNSSIDAQAYHRDLLENMPPPVAVIRRPPALPNINVHRRNQGRRIPRHGRDRRSGLRHHRRASAGPPTMYNFSLQFPSPKTSKIITLIASMATTVAGAAARNLLKSCRLLPQILHGQILGRSNATANLNNIAKDHHQIV